MLYVAVGTREDARMYASTLLGSSYLMITPQDLDYTTLDSELAGGLFGDGQSILLDGCYVHTEHHDALFERLSRIKDSSSRVVILEEKLLAKEKKELEPYAAEIRMFAKKEKKQANPVLFAVTDAYLTQDKKALWIAYQQALRAGFAAEEIHGTLWWQIKNLALVVEEKENPGLHPFVFSKLQKVSKKFTAADVLADGKSLIAILHAARTSQGNLEELLEGWVLGLE